MHSGRQGYSTKSVYVKAQRQLQEERPVLASSPPLTYLQLGLECCVLVPQRSLAGPHVRDVPRVVAVHSQHLDEGLELMDTVLQRLKAVERASRRRESGTALSHCICVATGNTITEQGTTGLILLYSNCVLPAPTHLFPLFCAHDTVTWS